MYDLLGRPIVMPAMFDADYRASSTNQHDLIVVLSSTNGYAFRDLEFDAPTLFVTDKVNFYYMRGFDALYLAIKEYIETGRFSRVIFVGISKAGWGALALSYLFASRDSRRYVCLAFSAPTQVWPPTGNIGYPSYRRLIEYAETDPPLMKALVHRGSLPDVNLSNLSITMYFGARNAVDREEASRLRGTSINLRPLAIGGHLSFYPFLYDTTSRQLMSDLLMKAHGLRSMDEENARFVDELARMPRLPHLTELVRLKLEEPPH